MANSTGDGAPPSAPPGTPPPRARTRPKGAPRPTIDVAPPPPETSARSAQSVMLGLGALLLGVAAVAFVGVLGELDPWGRLAILLAVALLGLAVPIPLAARGLTATAEAIAVVGLVLIGAAAYALWSTGTVTALSVPTYAGLASALTAGVGYGHHRLTGLPVPRFAGLILLQPIWPLLAYGVATGPADWALVLTLVATQNAVLGHLDLRLDLPASRRRLRYLAWAAHGVALLIAAGFAVVALVRGQTVDAAIRSAVTLLIVAAVGQVGALTLRRAPLPEVAAGALTLAVVGGACRVLTVALPGPTLLPVTAVVAITGGALVLLPPRARRGPGVALGVAAGLLGLVVAALALRAGAATVTAVLPPWSGISDGRGPPRGRGRRDRVAVADRRGGPHRRRRRGAGTRPPRRPGGDRCADRPGRAGRHRTGRCSPPGCSWYRRVIAVAVLSGRAATGAPPGIWPPPASSASSRPAPSATPMLPPPSWPRSPSRRSSSPGASHPPKLAPLGHRVGGRSRRPVLAGRRTDRRRHHGAGRVADHHRRGRRGCLCAGVRGPAATARRDRAAAGVGGQLSGRCCWP